MLGNQTVRIVAQTADSFRSGFDLYRVRLDKGYSLTDCISMQAMRGEGITDALTNDVHFEQEGFRAVLRGPQPALSAE
jgi:predicted nucleic acid-binding protein